MSGINNEKINNFYLYSKGLIEGKNGRELYEMYRDTLNSITPMDVVVVFDRLFNENFPIEDLKVVVNKILHAIYIPIRDYKMPSYTINGIVDLFIRDNEIMEEKLEEIKPLIKKINKKIDSEVLKTLKEKFLELSKFKLHYIAKENIIFSIFEKFFKNSGCVKIMWSFDDDIKRNIKKIISLLDKNFDLHQFNFLTGRLFFDMFAISFREKKILFAFMLENLDEGIINSYLSDVKELGLPFVKITGAEKFFNKKVDTKDFSLIDLSTGKLTPDEIILIFNNLPVDITFVDEKNEVKYFSTPKERIFPRTRGILGRKVQNCHPPESIDIVNNIIENFRNGQKDSATFWIDFNGKFILIQYFAVRDKEGNYRGVLEVTQDITEIKKLEGEKRLLDWK